MEVRIYDDYPEKGGKLIRTISKKELYARNKKGELVEVAKKNQIPQPNSLASEGSTRWNVSQHDIGGLDDAECQVI